MGAYCLKRFLCIIILCAFAFSFAAAESTDLPQMPDAELKTLKNEADAALLRSIYSTNEYPADDPVTGIWYMVEANMYGQPFDIAYAGLFMSIEIKPDMTFTASTNGVKNTGTWEQKDGRCFLEGQEIELSDGKLRIVTDDYVMVFSRQPIDTGVPQAVPATGEEDFLGDWMLDKVGRGGIVIPAGYVSDGIGTCVSMSIRTGSSSVDWEDVEIYREYRTTFAEDGLALSCEEDGDIGVLFSPLEKTEGDGIATTMSMDGVAEPVTLWLKRDPAFTETDPIPTFGLKQGMSRNQIVRKMERHGLTLFEEQYEETEHGFEGYLAFYGNAELFGQEATVIKVRSESSRLKYTYYFFDEEAEFRDRLPVPDARWYHTGELKGIYDRLLASLTGELGDPGDHKDWWRIGSTYYILSDDSEEGHMVYFILEP